MPNIELKASCPDLDRARQIAQELNAKPLWKDEQTDTYFETKTGKLKLRESKLNGSELLPYLKTDQAGLKRSDYARLPVQDPALTKTLLTDLLGKKFEIKKTREVYLIDNVRVHLDQVVGLGDFLEFEAVFESDTQAVVEEEQKKVAELMKRFGIDEAQLVQGSYPDLL